MLFYKYDFSSIYIPYYLIFTYLVYYFLFSEQPEEVILTNDELQLCDSSITTPSTSSSHQISTLETSIPSTSRILPPRRSRTLEPSTNLNVSEINLTKRSILSQEPSLKRLKMKSDDLSNFIIKTSMSQKEEFDKQIGRYIYATNSSFMSVEHPHFKKMVRFLRPGYNPPSRNAIGNIILETVYSEELESCKKVLLGQTVSVDFDGWSNIPHEPIICISLITENSGCYLVKTIDTSGSSHTIDYLGKLALETILEVEHEFNVKICSFVTDNAANMNGLRKKLLEHNENLIAYGCSAHIANLLAHDLDIPHVKNPIIEIVKHIRNNHSAAAAYKEAGGKKLILPNETRWNSVADCLDLYIKNWPILANMKLPKAIESKITDVNLRGNGKELLSRLKPISVALDKLQRDNTKISDAVEIWKDLENELRDLLHEREELSDRFRSRYNQAIQDSHIVSNMLDPRYLGARLSDDEYDRVINFVGNKFPSLLPIIMKLKGRSSPFDNPHIFKETLLKEITPCEWWKSMGNKISVDILNTIKIFLTGSATSASVERIFSKFGLVHSKLRNKLGVDKASKLVFLYKTLNEKTDFSENSEYSN